jgi:hypothetical protein
MSPAGDSFFHCWSVQYECKRNQWLGKSKLVGYCQDHGQVSASQFQSGLPLRQIVPTTIGILVVAFTLAYKSTVNWFFEGIFKWKSIPKENPTAPGQMRKRTEVVPAVMWRTSQFETLKGGIAVRAREVSSGTDLEAGGQRYPRQSMTQITRPNSLMFTAPPRQSTQLTAVASLQQGEVVATGALQPGQAP